MPNHQHIDADDNIAGGGLLHRRVFLRRGVAIAAMSATGTGFAAPLEVPAWSKSPGSSMSPYGSPAPDQQNVVRTVLDLYPAGIANGAGVSFTPLEHLQGTLTPNGLFFERHHSGVPEINADEHRLVVHGQVREARSFTVDDLMRFPMTSRIAFIECAGNSLFNSFAEPQQRRAGEIHGLVSCAEWTGIRLEDLLDQTGVDSSASWIIAEGADAAKHSRSIPMEKALGGDALIALYQNGERIRPEQGYPFRLVLPGWQGSTQTKWLRRLKVVSAPVHTKDETSKYTLLQKDGQARQFHFEMGVKSVITSPSPGVSPTESGVYNITGLAWSGAGRITRVEVSADGGQSWAEAVLETPTRPKALSRFQQAWQWDGRPTMLMSRAYDDQNNVQPTREAWYEPYAANQIFHQNAIQVWSVAENGEVSNVYI